MKEKNRFGGESRWTTGPRPSSGQNKVLPAHFGLQPPFTDTTEEWVCSEFKLRLWLRLGRTAQPYLWSRVASRAPPPAIGNLNLLVLRSYMEQGIFYLLWLVHHYSETKRRDMAEEECRIFLRSSSFYGGLCFLLIISLLSCLEMLELSVDSCNAVESREPELSGQGQNILYPLNCDADVMISLI